MPKILDGKKVRDAIAASLGRKIARLKKKPTLLIIQVGARTDSTAYIKQKMIFAEKIGAGVRLIQFGKSVKEAELLKAIAKANADSNIHGIIPQLPMPPHISPLVLIEAIDQRKDVDGLNARNTKLLYDHDPKGIVPATTRGIINLLDHYKIKVSSKRVCVVGRSALVGKPTAMALLNKDATITIAHTLTKDLKKVCREADILIVAIGDPEFITAEYVSKGQVVIDVGINVTEVNGQRKIVGDVNFAAVESIVSAISPVPGGVGPMTVASLFENLFQAYNQLQK